MSTVTVTAKKYKGVYKLSHNKFKVQIQTNGVSKYLGTFETQDDAARAYDIYSITISGVSAKTNFKYTDDFIQNVITQNAQNNSNSIATGNADGSNSSNNRVDMPIDEKTKRMKKKRLFHANIACEKTSNNITIHTDASSLLKFYPSQVLDAVGALPVDLGFSTIPSQLANRLVELASYELVDMQKKNTNRLFGNQVYEDSNSWRDQQFHWLGKILYNDVEKRFLWRGKWISSFVPMSFEDIFLSCDGNTTDTFEYRSPVIEGDNTDTQRPMHPSSGKYTGFFTVYDGDTNKSEQFADRECHITINISIDNDNGSSNDNMYNEVFGNGSTEVGGYFLLSGHYNSHTNYLYFCRSYVTDEVYNTMYIGSQQQLQTEQLQQQCNGKDNFKDNNNNCIDETAIALAPKATADAVKSSSKLKRSNNEVTTIHKGNATVYDPNNVDVDIRIGVVQTIYLDSSESRTQWDI